MVQLLTLVAIWNYTVLLISIFALIATLRFCNNVDEIYLPMAPKATADLHKVFIPPMRNMQIFVFVFDICVAFYITTMLPVFDGIKKKLPFFQLDAKVAEKPDCSSLILAILFVVLSKVS